MEQFIEKLIGRLEEEPVSTIRMGKDYIVNGNALPKERVLEIVKELAEEYNNDFCEWEIVSDIDIHREYKPMCFEDGFIEITGYFDYNFCPYCGKEIKVVEPKGE